MPKFLKLLQFSKLALELFLKISVQHKAQEQGALFLAFHFQATFHMSSNLLTSAGLNESLEILASSTKSSPKKSKIFLVHVINFGLKIF